MDNIPTTIVSAFLSPSPLHSSLQHTQLLCSPTPPETYHLRPNAKPHIRMGLFDAFKSALSPSKPSGDDNVVTQYASVGSKQLTAYFERVERINAMEPDIEALSDAGLQDAFSELRQSVSDSTPLDTILERVFALVREATFRVLSLRHYDVQLVGGIVLHEAAIAEMATGEGKTIVAALPAVLNALTGRPVFIVTVNDYLARRDAELIGQVFRFCGFSVGLIQAPMSPAERRAAYACDITYVTNSEIGFDYLRDNLAMNQSDIVLTRSLAYCIIDEADSILIDEARTPLIISGRVEADTQKYAVAKKAADALVSDVHYTVDEREQSVLLTEQGYADLEGALKVQDLFDPKNPWASFITNALKAKELFKKDVNYIVDDQDQSKLEIQIIDEFTGRALKGRRWSDGLHQAVEAKEDISVDKETSVIAKISYQAFFKLFEKRSGMTGTAVTEANELKDVYDLPVIAIPTALPMARKDYPDVVFKNATGKYRGVMGEIARIAPTGRPVLIGTTSVEASQTLSQLLEEVEVGHEVLNAKPESILRESEIVAQAGRKYSITIATNMAGRGTDILLGGNASYFARALARRELVRFNEPLYETLSNPDAPVLIESDDLPVEVSEEAMKQLVEAASTINSQLSGEKVSSLTSIDEIVSIAAEFGPIPDDDEGIEDLRDAIGAIKSELEVPVAEEREELLDLGGLYVIGTDRAESRRVDNQLRGRSGRQGDPGGSRFFLALDDNLFRVFGGDKMKGILESFRVDDDTPIENSLVNQTLDTSQQNVEEYFRGIRDSLLQYDEVLSTQRSAFYSDRRKIVVATETNLEQKFRDDCVETAKEILGGFTTKPKGPVANDSMDKLSSKLQQFFDGITNVSASDLSSQGDVELHVMNRIDEILNSRKQSLESVQNGFSLEVLRFLWLTQMDNMWQEHMKTMESVKEMVSLRSYGSEDPLQVFQTEGYELFIEVLNIIRRNNVYSYFQYKVGSAAGPATTKS